jgi:anti-anti-sigma factor
MDTKRGSQTSTVKILDLWGSLTVSTVYRLKKMVREAAETDYSEIILNFKAVDRVDSSGLGAIISCYVTLQRMKKKLSLINLNDKVKEIFFYTHISKIIKIYEAGEEIPARSGRPLASAAPMTWGQTRPQ